MAESDGEIRIKVNLETSEIDKDMQKLKDKLARQNESLERQAIVIEKLTARYDELREKAKNISLPRVATDRIQNSLHTLGLEIETAVKKEERLTSEVNRTKEAINELSRKRIDGLKQNIERVSSSLSRMGTKIQETQSKVTGSASKMGDVLSGVGERIGGIGKRILHLASSAFVFNLISIGFRGIARGMRNVIEHDEYLMRSLNQVRDNLATAFFPIYQAVLPALRALGQALSWVTGQIALFVSKMTGTSLRANQIGAGNMLFQTQGLKRQSRAYDRIGKAAKSASDKLANFDKINVLSLKHTNENNVPGVGSTGGNLTVGGLSQERQNFNTTILDRFTSRLKELGKVLAHGFNTGRVDRNLDEIFRNIRKVGGTVKQIFGDPNVTQGFNKALESVVYNLGTVVGSAASVGTTIGRLVVGGLSNFLTQSQNSIKEHLLRWFDITDRIANIRGKLSVAFAKTFQVLGEEEVQNSIGNMLTGCEKMFGDYATNIAVVATTTAEELSQPFLNHQQSIEEALRGMLISIETATEGTRDLLIELGTEMTKTTQDSIKPAIELLGNIWNDVFGKIVDGWKEYINPMLERMAKKWKETVEGRIIPTLGKLSSKFNELLERVLPLVQRLWDFLRPFVTWLINGAFDIITTNMSIMFDTVVDVISSIINLVASLKITLLNLIDVFVAIFQGDWQRAWQRAGDIVGGVVSAVKAQVNVLSAIVNGMINSLISGINVAIRAINRIHFDLPSWMGGGHFGLYIPEIPRASIPRLAQGAVLEGGNPFLAWVNDQPRGQTNVETPLATMVNAFRQAMQDIPQKQGDITIEASGDMAQLVSFLNLKLKQENLRVGNEFITGDAWI